MNVTPSGWSEVMPPLWERGHVPVKEGDLIEENDKITLACRDLDLYPIFTDLIPLEGWVGKRIAKVGTITGTNVVFEPGHVLTGNGDAHVFHFEDGTISAFFLDGNQVVSVFEDDKAPDVDLLVEAGMMTEEAKRERDREYDFDRLLRESLQDLTERRKRLQSSLLNAGRRDGHEIYKQIEETEAEIAKVNNQLKNYDWQWVRWAFDLKYITRWKPDLVDLFDWRSAEQQFQRRVDMMLPPEGKLIVAVHKIFDATGTTHQSNDVYALEFDDGSFSVGLGLAAGQNLELPIDGLLSAGLITSQQHREASGRLHNVHSQIASKQADNNRLGQLRKELEQPGLGEKRTRRILQEIALLKE